MESAIRPGIESLCHPLAEFRSDRGSGVVLANRREMLSSRVPVTSWAPTDSGWPEVTTPTIQLLFLKTGAALEADPPTAVQVHGWRTQVSLKCLTRAWRRRNGRSS